MKQERSSHHVCCLWLGGIAVTRITFIAFFPYFFFLSYNTFINELIVYYTTTAFCVCVTVLPPFVFCLGVCVCVCAFVARVLCLCMRTRMWIYAFGPTRPIATSNKFRARQTITEKTLGLPPQWCDDGTPVYNLREYLVTGIGCHELDNFSDTLSLAKMLNTMRLMCTT